MNPPNAKDDSVKKINNNRWFILWGVFLSLLFSLPFMISLRNLMNEFSKSLLGLPWYFIFAVTLLLNAIIGALFSNLFAKMLKKGRIVVAVIFGTLAGVCVGILTGTAIFPVLGTYIGVGIGFILGLTSAIATLLFWMLWCWHKKKRL